MNISQSKLRSEKFDDDDDDDDDNNNNNNNNSEEDTFLWLSSGGLKRETESEIITAQGQAFQTEYHADRVFAELHL